jgi:hypothetical protein
LISFMILIYHALLVVITTKIHLSSTSIFDYRNDDSFG